VDTYESACSTLLPPNEPSPRFETDTSALAIARIEAHYFIHRAFLAEDQLLRNLAAFATCPARSSGPLRHRLPDGKRRHPGRAWPEAEFIVVPTPAIRCASRGSRGNSSASSNACATA
jgi:proline iminopeptidase